MKEITLKDVYDMWIKNNEYMPIGHIIIKTSKQSKKLELYIEVVPIGYTPSLEVMSNLRDIWQTDNIEITKISNGYLREFKVVYTFETEKSDTIEDEIIRETNEKLKEMKEQEKRLLEKLEEVKEMLSKIDLTKEENYLEAKRLMAEQMRIIMEGVMLGMNKLTLITDAINKESERLAKAALNN